MTLGGSSVGTAAESAFHPSISMLFEFMRQCGMATDRAQVGQHIVKMETTGDVISKLCPVGNY